MDADEVDALKWDSWNRALATLAGQLSSGRRDEESLARLYELAVELRDKLRLSQGRVRSLKQELAVTSAAARSERHEALARLQELETEVARLAGAVQTQGSTLAAREAVAQAQAAENEQLRRQVVALERQLQAQNATLSARDAAATAEAADNEQLRRQIGALERQLQAQSNAISAQEAATHAEANEGDRLRRQVAALERQLQRLEEDRMATANERNEALRHLDKMTQLLEESEGRVAAAQAEHNNLLNELVSTKGKLADLSGLETLYGAARDELERLDKENLELKDMVAGGAVQLGRSRILEALGVPDSSDLFVSTRAAGSGGGAGGIKHAIGSPSASAGGGALTGGGSAFTGAGGAGAGAAGVLTSSGALVRSRSAPRTRPLSAGFMTSPGTSVGTYGRGAFVPELVPASADVYRARGGASRRRRTLSPGRASGAAFLEDPVSDMAFLGPPSSAYPPDPDNYVFYRVGGGYSPRLDPVNPTIPQPRASGWVPKDVVRLVQAFRHSYGIQLEWRFWEPLVLMVDEVYRSRADGTLAAMRTAQREKLKTVKRQLRSALGYPSALANGKISYLQRQLSSARKVMAAGDRKSEVPLKQMAVKDYHLGYQLDRAVEENYALRRSLEDLEELYSSAIEGGGYGHAYTGGGGGGGGGGGRASSRARASRATPTRGSSVSPAATTPTSGGGGGGRVGSASGRRRSDAAVFTLHSPRHSPRVRERDDRGTVAEEQLRGQGSFEFGAVGVPASGAAGGGAASGGMSAVGGRGDAGSTRGSGLGYPGRVNVGVGGPEMVDVGVDNASLSIAS